MNTLRTLAFLFFAAVFVVSNPAFAASDGAGIMALFNRAVAAFNAGDMAGWEATCVSPAAVIDDFPPHFWHGASACAKWWAAYQADAKANGMSGGSVTLGKPSHVAVDGNSGYLVVPATYTYRLHGKPASEAGLFTVTFTRQSGRWLMSAWAWADQ